MSFIPVVTVDTVSDSTQPLKLTYAADAAGRICFRYTDSTDIQPWRGPIPNARATDRAELIAYIRKSHSMVHTSIVGDDKPKAGPLITRKEIR